MIKVTVQVTANEKERPLVLSKVLDTDSQIPLIRIQLGEEGDYIDVHQTDLLRAINKVTNA